MDKFESEHSALKSEVHTTEELGHSIISSMQDNSESRFIVALAGAPGSGKSTVANLLVNYVNREKPGLKPVVMPMDGFHLDNSVLSRLELSDRKGAPQTFDASGYVNALLRIRENRETVWVPEFDRSKDLSRSGAIEINCDNRLVITEGNYLLLTDNPWQQIRDIVDKTVLIDVGMDTLTNRLMQRWLDHGFSEQEARSKLEDNDLKNARYMFGNSSTPDWRLTNG